MVKAIGFLALFQNELAGSVNIPVFTSSLMQVPLVYSMLKPSQKVGIITIHSRSLTQRHLSAVGADQVPHVILGTEGGKEFSRAILDDELELDVEKARVIPFATSQQSEPTLKARDYAQKLCMPIQSMRIISSLLGRGV